MSTSRARTRDAQPTARRLRSKAAFTGHLRPRYIAAPVHDLQRGLEKLRVFRIRTLPMWIVTGCLWWVPMTVIALRWLGIDLWLRAPTALAWLLASGVAALAGFWAVWRWLPGAVVSLQRDAVGASLERSRRFLDEIERYERG